MRDTSLLTISMIGKSGSGKTMMLGGIFDAFVENGVEGKNGAVISATGSLKDPLFRENDESGIMNGLTVAQHLAKYKRERTMAVQGRDGKIGKAAAGTVEMAHIHLDLNVDKPNGEQASLPIKLTDYRGGLLSIDSDRITETDIGECRAITDNLFESEIIIVLLDGIMLAQYRDNAFMRKKKTGADRINVLLNAVMKDSRRAVTLMLVVTKVDSDKIPDDLKRDNYKELCNLACETVECVYKKSRIMTQSRDWTFAVVPATAIGEGNSITQCVPGSDEYYCAIRNSADVKQNNIDAVMLYAVRNALTQRLRLVDKEITQCERSISDKCRKMNLFNAAAVRSFINELSGEKEDLSDLRNEYSSMLSAMNEEFSGYYEPVRRFGMN